MFLVNQVALLKDLVYLCYYSVKATRFLPLSYKTIAYIGIIIQLNCIEDVYREKAEENS